MFLLYIGPVCLEGLLPGGAYGNVLNFVVSFEILPHSYLCKTCDAFAAFAVTSHVQSFLISMVYEVWYIKCTI